MRTLVVFWSLGATVLTAADPQVVVVEESSGSFLAPVTTTERQEVQKQITVQLNGRFEQKTVTEKVPVSVTKHVVIDAKAGDFLDRAGRPMDPKAVAALLKKGTVLVISPDGTPVGPDLLKKNEQIQAILLFRKAKDEKGPAPKLGVLEKDSDGRFHVEVTVTGLQTYRARYALADAKLVTDLGGNLVDVRTLRPGSKVAVSTDYKPVDPGHIHELKGVVAVVVPSEVPAP
jgi:hypothetical protein